MTDREMLEMAARAAGLNYDHRYGIVFGEDDCGNATEDGWNSLLDDGDALRLAVKLLIRVSVNRAFGLSIPGSVTVEYQDRDGFYFALGEAVTNSDPYAATRRAITRAAAEIGRQMEEQS